MLVYAPGWTLASQFELVILHEYIHICKLRASFLDDTLRGQPVELLAVVPLPVGHVLEPPAKVAQLAMLEQRGASRLMRPANEVGRTVHFHRNPLPIIQSNERVDAVSGGLATMLFLYLGAV